MITDVNNQQYTPCIQSNCQNQSLQPGIQRAQQLFKDDNRVEISDEAKDRFRAQKSNNAIIKAESDLGEEEKRKVDKLKKQHQEVRVHEKAHMAVGGEVKIDASKENHPEATIRKLQKARRAALAPAQPSGQDRSVAARASQIEAEARIALQREKSESTKEKDDQQQVSPSSMHQNPFKDDNIASEIGNNLSVIV